MNIPMKINCNPDPAEQAQEQFFSRKVQVINYPPLKFLGKSRSFKQFFS